MNSEIVFHEVLLLKGTQELILRPNKFTADTLDCGIKKGGGGGGGGEMAVLQEQLEIQNSRPTYTRRTFQTLNPWKACLRANEM